MSQEKIGIIGLGFVGNAIKQSYINDPSIQLIEIDSDPTKGCKGTYEELTDALAVFVCVPSPMNADGSCGTLPLVSTLSKLKSFKGVIISKVTAPPDAYEYLQTQYPTLVHAPEFLTAANAVQDYMAGKFAIIGGSDNTAIDTAHRIIKRGQRMLEMPHICKIGEASLTKYVINSFLSTKVIFMNEMAKLAETGGQNWEKIRELVALDRRIGNSHTQVPGPDGQFGFGGACFPKDTSALLKYSETLNVPLNVLDSAVKKNLLLRLTDSK